MTTVLEWDQVTKLYGQTAALDRFSLAAEPGSVVALLGDNGAGKTTAIRILLGLIEPTAGRSQVFGLDSQVHGELIRQQVGYVPDRPTLYDWMTIDEIGWFTSGFYAPGFYQRFCELIRQFGLPIDRKIKHLSKGMKSKVALALGLGHDPKLLVLDEPTSGLDPVVRREFLESMVDVAASGRTVLISSHQIAEIERIADVIVILRQGKTLLTERLDRLKAEIREITLTVKNGELVLPALPGQLISHHRRDRQWRLLLRATDESHFTSLRETGSITDYELRTPCLEDIFVGYLKGESCH